MNFSTWLMFLAASLVAACTPGPGVLLAISNTVAHGSRSAILASLGNMAGLFMVSGATMIGLGTLLKTSATLFLTLKLFGAGYLIFLGVRQWRSRENLFARAGDAQTQIKPSNEQLFLQGFFLAPTNPKAILFFTALFPQFLKADQPVLPQFFILTATFAICTVVSHTAYTLLAHHTRSWFSNNRRARAFNRVSGGAFVLLGMGMLRLKNRQV